MLRLHLFGGVRLEWDGDALRRPSRNALSVLAYLLLHHDERVPRAGLAFALWPDDPEATAFARLRRALFTLNEALPQSAVPFILAGKQDIAWNVAAGAWADVIAFREFAAVSNEARSAIAVYTGSLLPDVDEEWLVEPRERFAREYDRLLETVVSEEREAGNITVALRFSDMHLAADPLREDVARVAMELRMANADRAGAVRVYRRLAERLKHDVGAEPDPVTTALFQRILSADATAGTRRRTNVVRAATTFVGREDDVRAVVAHFAGGTRLLTVTGPGGIGKSRLVREVAFALLDEYPGGIWLVDIADGSTADLAFEAVARALEINAASLAHVREAVERHLREQKTLLVLDGCERALVAAVEFVDGLLHAGERTHILAASRERMRLPAEATHVLDALRVPDAPVAGAREAMTFSAIDLFVKRARMIGGGLFDISDANAEIVRTVVARTAGIPLAIELAVPWLRMIGIEELADRLADRFSTLVATADDVPERHQTLDALIGWSYESLSDEMRALFDGLAVFPASFTLDAAIAVCAHAGTNATAAFERLAGLVDKSLVQSAGSERRRFSLLDVVREFALRRQTPARIAAARNRLASYIVDVAEAMDRERDAGKPERVWMKTLADERAAIDATLNWTLDADGDSDAGIRLTILLMRYFEGEPYENARRWFERALDAIGDERSERYAYAAMGREMFSRWARPTPERLAVLEDAADVLKSVPKARNLQGVLGLLAWTRLRCGRPEEAYAAAREGTAVARERGSAQEVAFALRTEAQTMPRDDRERRLAVLRESLALLEPFEPGRLALASHMYLLEVLCETEPWDPSVRGHADDLVRLSDRAKGIPPHVLTLCDVYVAGCRLGFGEIAAGADAASRALRIATETVVDVDATAALECLAFVHASRANWDTAARLIGYSDAVSARGGRLDLAVTRIMLARARGLVADRLEESTFAVRREEGAAWDAARAATAALEREGKPLSVR